MSATEPELPSRGEAQSPEVADVLGTLRGCYQRALEREGIPMVVALDDVRPGRRPVVTDPVSLADGSRFADLLSSYYAQLEAAGFPDYDPEPAPDETGARELIDALVVLSEQHLRAVEEQA